MGVRLDLPEWVHPVALDDRDTAVRRFADVLAEAAGGQVLNQGELEAAADQVVSEGIAQGAWLVALVRPPGADAALLSVLGLPSPAELDESSSSTVAATWTAEGQDATVVPTRTGTAVVTSRRDHSGDQAQAMVADEDACFLITLAAPGARGPELRSILTDIVATTSTE